MDEAAFGVATCATNVSLQHVPAGWLAGVDLNAPL